MIQPGCYRQPSRQMVIHGHPVAEALPKVLGGFWATGVVLVTNSSLARPGGLAERVREILGGTCLATVEGVHENTPRGDVVRIAEALRGRGMDAVVALGGGSVVEAAKAARLCLTNNIGDAAGLDRLRTTTTTAPPRPYLVSIPTTLSAAEYTPLAGVTDERTGVKDAFHHQDLAPDAVILDPAMTLATPERLWLGTGMRALDHAVETWCAPHPTPVSDATSIHAARLLVPALTRCREVPDDLDARHACQVGSWLSIQGATIGVSHGASHGIGHALNAVAGVPPGIASSVMLAPVLRFNAPANGGRQRELAEATGAGGLSLADHVAGIVARLGLPGRLRDAGVERGRLDAIAEAALANPRIKANPRLIEGRSDMLGILEAAW